MMEIERYVKRVKREKRRKPSADETGQLKRITWIKSQMAGACDKVQRGEWLRDNLKKCEDRRVCPKRRRGCELIILQDK